jgi:quercetin dioxygenase-like cupin family protein
VVRPRSNGPFVARLDAHGRSTIGADRLDFVSRPGNLEVAELLASAGAPVSTLSGPTVAPLDVNVRPGGIRTLVTNMPAGYDSGLHRTDTVDFSVVLDGQVTFAVETGEVTLDIGDCVLVCGVLHAWRALRPSTIAVMMTGVAMDRGAGLTWP